MFRRTPLLEAVEEGHDEEDKNRSLASAWQPATAGEFFFKTVNRVR